MTQAQVRILLSLYLAAIPVTAARGQTLLPFIVDASGSLRVLDADDEPSAVAKTGPETAPAEAGKKDDQPAAPALTPEMVASRDQTRRILSQIYARSLSAPGSVPVEVIAFCEAFGHTAEIASGGRSAQKLNAVGALCWNFPCSGYTLLRSDGDQTIARVGYGYQDRPAQLLAMLAQNRVPASYEIHIGDHRGTVADLVETEKLACRQGLVQSGTLIGLAFYVKPADTWKNDLGETWSVQRLLQAELDRKADAGSVDVVDRLMAISFALKHLKDEDLQSGGLRQRAEDHVKELQKYALQLQNSDGTWHPGFFAYRGPSKDTEGSLLATGAILSWLIYSLPADRLEDPQLVRGLAYLQKQLASTIGRRSVASSSTRELVAQMKAARALSLYDARYFTPRTPTEPATPAAPSGKPQQTGRSQERSSQSRS